MYSAIEAGILQLPGLLAKISQVLFHRLDFQLQVHQVAFQIGDLFRLGLVAPLKVPAVAAALAPAPGMAIAITGLVTVAITFFAHVESPYLKNTLLESGVRRADTCPPKKDGREHALSCFSLRNYLFIKIR
jgi:hypothetical protein